MPTSCRANYRHHIENLDDAETHFLVFFDQAEGQDIGHTGGTAAMPERTMAPTLGVGAGDLPRIPGVMGDLLIVRKQGAHTSAGDPRGRTRARVRARPTAAEAARSRPQNPNGHGARGRHRHVVEEARGASPSLVGLQ